MYLNTLFLDKIIIIIYIYMETYTLSRGLSINCPPIIIISSSAAGDSVTGKDISQLILGATGTLSYVSSNPSAIGVNYGQIGVYGSSQSGSATITVTDTVGGSVISTASIRVILKNTAEIFFTDPTVYSNNLIEITLTNPVTNYDLGALLLSASDQPFNFTISTPANPTDAASIATIDTSTGIITPVGPGNFTVTVTQQVKSDPNNLAYPFYRARTKTIDFKLNPIVVPPPPSADIKITSLTVNPTKIILNKLKKKLTKLIIASVEPNNATNQTLIWSSNKPKIIKVNSSGLVVGKKIGNATITCKTTDGSNISKNINVIFKPK